MEREDVLGHTLSVTAEGEVTATHPQDDVEDCDFDAYVARDWQTPPLVFRPSEHDFIRRTENGNTFWMGSRTDQTGWRAEA